LSLELEEDRRDLALVNKLRADVKRWRNAGWEGATNVTKDLLRHWQRRDRPRRFFFCQLEAAETIIFLNEIRGFRRDRQRGKPRWNPEFTDSDFDLLWKPADGSVEPLTRYACKMATGSGKTVVMAMLVTWAFCNRARVPSDDRFPHAVLICCPNLTIKERLQVLRTDHRGDDYYTQFDLVPPQYRDLLRTGKVLITNWHFFAPESEHSEGGKSYAVVKKGEETDEAFARKRLGELFDRGPIMVLNDEGHHAYRPAPISEKEAKATGAEIKKDREEATIWLQGLDRMACACGIKFCVDLSATPFYIKGSGYPEGAPFPWIVSDFGLVDAIESGITKIPRLPVSDTTGQPDPKYFRLWRNITKDLAAGQRQANKRPKPEIVWERSQDAFVQLAGEYKQAFDAVAGASDTALKAPPVLILVCDNTDIAQVFFENISGQKEMEEIPDHDEEDEEDAAPKARRKKPRMRGLARHELFPQVLRIVRRYVAEKVDRRGQHPCELGLEKYVRRIKERLVDAIVPNEQEGEAPLLPILNRYQPIGTTAYVDFTTKRNVHSTIHSHVNAVVLDSAWEQTAAFYLEQQTDHVVCYARNDRPFLLIPYEYEGAQHHYEPDYLVSLKNGRTLLLEMKGEEDDRDRQKHQAARRWVTAVNHWGRLGGWDFLVCRDPQLLPKLLAGRR